MRLAKCLFPGQTATLFAIGLALRAGCAAIVVLL